MSNKSLLTPSQRQLFRLFQAEQSRLDAIAEVKDLKRKIVKLRSECNACAKKLLKDHKMHRVPTGAFLAGVVDRQRLRVTQPPAMTKKCCLGLWKGLKRGDNYRMNIV